MRLISVDLDSQALLAKGLVGQYFPKGMDFTAITQQEINHAMKRLNNRPGKRLGYLTPAQEFFKSGVALQN
jgi:IS30 family transposase